MEAAGFILAAILGAISVLLFKTVGTLAQENIQLKKNLMKYDANKYLYDINNLIANMNAKAAPAPKLHKQTEQLLVLAVRSSNENEARSAAVQACKRIHKELGIK